MFKAMNDCVNGDTGCRATDFNNTISTADIVIDPTPFEALEKALIEIEDVPDMGANAMPLQAGDFDRINRRTYRRRGVLRQFGAASGWLEPGEGLWITPCESIHTLFMKFPIDLVYIDKGRKVRKVRHSVPPWRLSMCLTAHSILELPPGTARETGTVAGDVLAIEKLG